MLYNGLQTELLLAFFHLWEGPSGALLSAPSGLQVLVHPAGDLVEALDAAPGAAGAAEVVVLPLEEAEPGVHPLLPDPGDGDITADPGADGTAPGGPQR